MKVTVIMARTLNEAEIERAVEGLSNFGNNTSALIELLMYGKAAVKPLVRFLHSYPSVFCEPRCLAADALCMIGGIEAVEGLIQVLDLYDLELLDPQIRLAEETIRNRAARNLGALGDETAREPLLRSLKENHLRGAAEALATYRDIEAVPYIIEMLGDDYAREAAAKALVKFGGSAVEHLLETLNTKTYDTYKYERRSSVIRRREAATLLGEIRDPRAVQHLVVMLEDDEWQVRLFSALSILKICGNQDAPIKAFLELISELNVDDWYIRTLCIDALSEPNPTVIPYMERVFSERIIENARREKIALSQDAVRCLKEAITKQGNNKGKGISDDENI
jgi:HEAT repeat protein